MGRTDPQGGAEKIKKGKGKKREKRGKKREKGRGRKEGRKGKESAEIKRAFNCRFKTKMLTISDGLGNPLQQHVTALIG